MTVKFTAPILALGLLAGSAIVPAGAEDQKHPPTNRVGEEVPTMTKDTDKDTHAPTNRVGEAVPTMTDDNSSEAKATDMDDNSTSKQ